MSARETTFRQSSPTLYHYFLCRLLLCSGIIQSVLAIGVFWLFPSMQSQPPDQVLQPRKSRLKRNSVSSVSTTSSASSSSTLVDDQSDRATLSSTDSEPLYNVKRSASFCPQLSKKSKTSKMMQSMRRLSTIATTPVIEMTQSAGKSPATPKSPFFRIPNLRSSMPKRRSFASVRSPPGSPLAKMSVTWSTLGLEPDAPSPSPVSSPCLSRGFRLPSRLKSKRSRKSGVPQVTRLIYPPK